MAGVCSSKMPGFEVALALSKADRLHQAWKTQTEATFNDRGRRINNAKQGASVSAA